MNHLIYRADPVGNQGDPDFVSDVAITSAGTWYGGGAVAYECDGGPQAP